MITRLAAGDRSALHDLVEHTRDRLYRYLRHLVRSDEAAEDALQEVFVGVWRSAPAFRGEVSGRVWLYTIARRQAARTWRRRAGEPADMAPLDDLARAAGFGGPDPERIALAAEERSAVQAALGRLTEDDREVIVLRDIEGLSGPEAATMLGIEVGALKSRLHRARLRLMAELRPVGGPWDG
jgi:RNA polymerase sigma-70 factor (ECF subfamily)